MSEIQEHIRSHILGTYLTDGEADSFRDDADLLTVLDSLQILRILMELESVYSIKVDNSELTPENLGSIEKLAAFIARKRDEQESSGEATSVSS